MRNSTFSNCVFCDDIRHEKNGKYVLVGVHGGVTSFLVEGDKYPSETLAVYVEANVVKNTDFGFKLQYEGDSEPLFEIRGKVDIEHTEGFIEAFGKRHIAVPMPLGRQRLRYSKSGRYQFFGSVDDGPWQKINEILVVLEDAEGNVIGPATPLP